MGLDGRMTFLFSFQNYTEDVILASHKNTKVVAGNDNWRVCAKAKKNTDKWGEKDDCDFFFVCV